MNCILTETNYRPANHAGRLFFFGTLSLLIHIFVLGWLVAPPGGKDGAPRQNLLPLRLTVTIPDGAPSEALRPAPDEPTPLNIPHRTENIDPPPPSPLPYYYRRSELTTPPQTLSDPGFEDPQRFPTTSLGQLELRLFIDEHGHVDEVAVLSSTLPDDWTKLAVETFRTTRFTPGRLGNVAVSSQIRIMVGVGDPDSPGKVGP